MTHGRSFFHSEYLPLPFPARQRLSSAAAAHGLLPSAAPTTSGAGRPDLGRVGVNSPQTRRTSPSSPLCGAAEGSWCLSAVWGGWGKAPAGRFSPRPDTADGFRGDREEKVGGVGGERRCGQLKPGLEPAAKGRGGAGQSRGGGGHNGRVSRSAAGRGRPRRAKSSRSSREASTCNSSSSKTPRSLMLRRRDPVPRLPFAEGA